MTEEVKQPTDDESWAQVIADRAAAPADDAPLVEEPVKVDPADPYAGLPEPTRKLIEGLQSSVNEQAGTLKKVNQALATAHGTIGNLKQRLDASQVQLQTIAPVVESVEAQKKAAEEAKLAEKAAKRKALRERLNDLPDVAELMDELLPDEPPVVKPEPKVEVKPEIKPEEVKTVAPDREAQLIAERELSDLHPGWISLVKTPEFKTWVEAQPDDVRQLSASDDIADAAKMLTAFKKHKSDAAKVAQIEKDRQARLRRGESVQGRGSSSGDVDGSDGALWNQVTRDRAKAQA